MNSKQKTGLLLILGGLLLIGCALILHTTQQQQDRLAGENAQILLQQLQQDRFAPVQSHPEDPETATQPPEDESQTQVLPLVMPEKEYLGYSTIGIIRVPSVGIELPVLSSWSYPLLNVAPCRYTGSIPGEDLIIMGHNYVSHFTPLHGVQVGAEVEFENMYGFVYRYRVDKIEYLHKTQEELLYTDYPLTLFTCTPGGQERIVVRCTSTDQG